MGRTLTALIAAGALVLAACGDDSGGDEEDAGEETSEEAADDTGEGGSESEAEGEGEGSDAAGGGETVDSGTDGAAAGGDAQAFCDLIISQDQEALVEATPPAEIADAWNEVMANPDNIDPDSDAPAEIEAWVSANCAAPGAGDETGAGAEGDTGAGDTGAVDGGDDPGADDFMEDFCVDLPEGVDNDMAC